MEELGGESFALIGRIGSCGYELAQLLLFVVVLVVALRIKRSIGAYLFAASTLGGLVVALAYEVLDATDTLTFDTSAWVYAFGGVLDIVLVVVGIVGIAMIRPKPVALLVTPPETTS